MHSEDMKELAVFGVILRGVNAAVPEPLWRQRAKDGSFSLVEHACHLADLEEEAFGVRIERLLGEDRPHLPDFAGDVIARERQYIEQAMTPAFDRYARAREENRRRFRALSDADWSRRGTQEHVGDVTLGSLLEAMLSHDHAHANEIVALLHDLGVAPSGELLNFADRAPLARSA
jgi:uncharacterized damage-inducible protein DinB